jgi:hypothetical protein
MSAKYIVWNIDRARPANEGLPMTAKAAGVLADALERDTGDNYVLTPAPDALHVRRALANH